MGAIYQFPSCYVPPPCDSEPRPTDMRIVREYRLGTLVTLMMWVPVLAVLIWWRL